MTNRLYLIALMIMTIVSVNAQKSSVSPYSFFGMGDASIRKTAEEISMGETGVVDYSSHQLFFSNPASLAFLSFTTYDLGLSNRGIKVSDGTTTEHASATTLSYLALGVPIGNKAGFMFGLQPNTNVGYSLLQQFVDTANVVNEFNLFSGQGGTNRLFLAYAKKIHKFASIGVEGSFIFGKLSNNVMNKRLDAIFASQYEANSNVSGFNLKFGFQYHAPVVKKDKNIQLQLGATVNLSSSYTNRGDELLYSFLSSGTSLITAKDTVVNQGFNGKINVPLKSVIGVGIGQQEHWNVALEYETQGGISYSGGYANISNNVQYKTASRISLGGYYLPNFNSVTSYWDKVSYRAGIKYKKSGLVINNTDINQFGISFGAGLPMGKELSTFNLGIELGKRGTITNGLIKEKYLNIRIGLTLNDKWFTKRKIL